MRPLSQRLTDLFPLWAVLLAAVAISRPAPFTPLAPAIPWLLGVVMLSMGLTLELDSFRLVLRRPQVVAVGVASQFTVMPAVAWQVARGLDLEPTLATGLILVGCCPGGTASNVVTFLAKGDVALSVTLTAVSTLLSVVATPLLTLLYAGAQIDVPAAKMLLSVAQIVLLPVAAGVALNTLLGQRLGPLRSLLPLVSVAGIVLIIAVIAALNASRLPEVGTTTLLAVAAHNALGLAGGYSCGRLLGCSPAERRTLAIEVGMQNSGLGVALATQHFSALAALPGAVFSLWHNLTGAAVAAWWGRGAGPRDGAQGLLH